LWLPFIVLEKKKMYLLIVLPLIFSGFISYGGLWDYNLEFSLGQSFIQKIWILWRPDWNFTVFIPHPSHLEQVFLRGVFVFFYIPTMLVFWRKIRWTDFELWLFIGMTLVVIFSFGNERFREPVMPFVIGYTTSFILNYISNFTTTVKNLFITSHKS